MGPRHSATRSLLRTPSAPLPVRFSHAACRTRAKAANSGRPPRAPQAGVAVSDGPACTSPPPCIMLA
eukprot:4876102-Prymnesium_polylepis.1